MHRNHQTATNGEEEEEEDDREIERLEKTTGRREGKTETNAAERERGRKEGDVRKKREMSLCRE